MGSTGRRQFGRVPPFRQYKGRREPAFGEREERVRPGPTSCTPSQRAHDRATGDATLPRTHKKKLYAAHTSSTRAAGAERHRLPRTPAPHPHKSTAPSMHTTADSMLQEFKELGGVGSRDPQTECGSCVSKTGDKKAHKGEGSRPVRRRNLPKTNDTVTLHDTIHPTNDDKPITTACTQHTAHTHTREST